jgi:hemolysin D
METNTHSIAPLHVPLAVDDRGRSDGLIPLVEIATDEPISPIRLGLMLALSGFGCITLLIAFVVKIDIYATAQARIQPPGRSKIIQPLDTGKVRALHVQNGSHVHQGDLLMELDPTETAADRDAIAAQIADLDAEIARRRTAIAGAHSNPSATNTPQIEFPPGLEADITGRESAVLAADLAHLSSTLESLDSQIAVNLATKQAAQMVIGEQVLLIAKVRESLSMLQAVAQKGLESKAHVLNLEQQLAAQLATLASLKGQALRADVSARSVATQKIETVREFEDEQSQALATALEKRRTLAEDLVKATAKVGYTRMLAPITGVVQEITVSTLGQVVIPGQALMIVVPDDAGLEVEAMVANQDIGFIEPGETAILKIDSFPFTRYGTITGKVVRVSHDSVSGSDATPPVDSPNTTQTYRGSASSKVRNLVYPITIALEKTTMIADGKIVPLMAGMDATVEIRTGSRRLIDFVLAPVREVTSEAGHER